MLIGDFFTELVAPKVIVIRNKTVVQGTKLLQTQLFCNATGNPKPDITWYFFKDGKAIQVNNEGSDLQGDPDNCKQRTDDFYFLQRDDPKHLVICNPKKRHTGQYKCHAANFLDEKEGSVFINVQSEYSKASSTQAILYFYMYVANAFDDVYAQHHVHCICPQFKVWCDRNDF